VALLDLLDRYTPTIEAELDGHLAAHRARQASEISERALRLARDILDLDEFRDLALPGGLAKRERPEPPPAPGSTRASKARKKPNDSSKAPGDRASDRGRHIRYEEVAFEDASRAHSRFVAGTVQANTLHPDYQQAARSSEARLIYAALMIGKESIAFNDRFGHRRRLPGEAARLLLQAQREEAAAIETPGPGPARRRAGASRARARRPSSRRLDTVLKPILRSHFAPLTRACAG
jgi:hypothetical protein